MGRFKIPVGVGLFIATWLLVLCVPTTRDIPYLLNISAQVGANQYEIEQSVPETLARAFPKDPVAIGWKAETVFYRGQKNEIKHALARFPDDLTIRAIRLQTASQSMRSSSGNIAAKDAAQKADYRECARIARKGGTLEPNNAFWPWMEAAFEFSVGQSDAALRAFERLQSCTRYDDYIHQRLQARLNFWQSHEDPSFELKLNQLLLSVLLPHLSALRESSELAAARAVELRHAGDNARAIAVENGVLTAMRLMSRDGNNIISILNGESGARKALGQFFSIPKPRETNDYVDPAIYGGELARAWASYARANGRPELAQSADFVGEPSASQQWGEWIGNNYYAQFGFKQPWGTIATAGPLLLFLLACAVFAGALFWAFSGLVRASEPAPARGTVVACANFSFWLLLGLCALVVVQLGIRLSPYISFAGDEMIAFWTALNFFALATLCWLLPVWFVNLKRGRTWRRNRPDVPRVLPTFWNRARKAAWLVGLAGLALVGSNGRGLWDDTMFQFPYARWIAGVGLALAFSLELARWNLAGTRIRWSRDGAERAPTKFPRWAPWLVWGATLVGFGVLIAGIAQGAILFDQIVRAVLTLLALCGALWASWRAARDHFGWQLARRTLGALVLMWSVTTLFFAIALMPLRAQLNRNLDRQIRIGEIAWMREQIAEPK